MKDYLTPHKRDARPYVLGGVALLVLAALVAVALTLVNGHGTAPRATSTPSSAPTSLSSAVQSEATGAPTSSPSSGASPVAGLHGGKGGGQVPSDFRNTDPELLGKNLAAVLATPRPGQQVFLDVYPALGAVDPSSFDSYTVCFADVTQPLVRKGQTLIPSTATYWVAPKNLPCVTPSYYFTH